MPKFYGEANGQAKLTAKQVKEIRKLRKKGHGPKLLAYQYGICPQHVYEICKRNNWKELR